ncbi:unnamed protein product, partial [Tetraodon nigroviridis]
PPAGHQIVHVRGDSENRSGKRFSTPG